MRLEDILRQHVRPCPAQMDRTPFWRCDLPTGHTGEHASLHANFWSLSA